MKAVAQGIPTYAMSIFKFPAELCNEIQSLINSFWWGLKNNSRKIHLISKEKLAETKCKGGLGFRLGTWKPQAFNATLLAKQV